MVLLTFLFPHPCTHLTHTLQKARRPSKDKGSKVNKVRGARRSKIQICHSNRSNRGFQRPNQTRSLKHLHSNRQPGWKGQKAKKNQKKTKREGKVRLQVREKRRGSPKEGRFFFLREICSKREEGNGSQGIPDRTFSERFCLSQTKRRPNTFG